MRLKLLFLFSLISSTSFSANACWEGYTADAVKATAPVYAQVSAEGRPFQVATLQKNQKICVEYKSSTYAHIQYEDANQPNVPKFGYVALSSLRSSTEAVVACNECNNYLRPNNNPRPTPEPLPVQEIERPVSRGGLGEPLPYADRIQRSVNAGYGIVGKNFCGRAVGRILRAAGVLPGGAGSKSTPSGFNGEDAYNYLMSAPGDWVDDKSACNRPGVVLVHGDVDDSLKSRYRPGTRGYLKGDTYGHVEILGTDGNYHHFTSSSAPIDVILGNRLRRPLLHCMVSRSAMRGAR